MTPRLVIVDHEGWSPRRFHSTMTGELVWRQTDEGIEVQGDGVRRTAGEPITLRRIVASYGPELVDTSKMSGVPQQMLAAIVAAESKGYPDAEREEPGLNDISIGLTQTLTATARDVAKRAPSAFGLQLLAMTKPVPEGGDVDTWRALLSQPHYAIRLAAVYVALADDAQDLQLDPVLCYAAYNAGSARVSHTTPWGIHYYRKALSDGSYADAMENFVAWYGDACYVYGSC